MTAKSGLALRAKILAVLVRDARQACGRTIKECAERLGISSALYAAYEAGKQSPSLPELEVLAHFFDLPLSHFWGDRTLSDRDRRDGWKTESVLQLRQRIIGAQLRQARSEAGYSLRQLAEKVGLPPGRISAYEFGRKPIPLPELEALAWGLGLQVEHFFEPEGPIGRWHAAREAAERFAQLPPELQEFVTRPVNESYLRLAMRLSELKVDRLRSIAEDLLDITY